MSGIGFTGILLIVVIGLLLFGPKKLPELGRALGQTLKEFKDGAAGVMKEDSQANAAPQAPVQQQQPQVQQAQQPAEIAQTMQQPVAEKKSDLPE